MTTPRKKLIEVSIPLEAVNKEARRRKQKAPKGYPTSIHKYWAQRPVAACRAVIFTQLVDDPSAWPEKFPTQEAQDTERLRLHRVAERMLTWEASGDPTILNEARWEIARSVAWGIGDEPPARSDGNAILAYLQEKAPPIYDPFSGGGSIPLEAQRLGLRVYGSDLNPLAVLIGKALVEFPAKFSGCPPVNSEAQLKLQGVGGWHAKGASGLAEDVRHYGNWMREAAEESLRNYYPPVDVAGQRGKVVAWIWARTVRSPDPRANGSMVPLLSTYLLSTNEKKRAWLVPELVPEARDGYRLSVSTGEPTLPNAVLGRGTKAAGRGSDFVCILTGSVISGDYIKSEGMAGRLGYRMVAVVAEVGRSRTYLPADEHQEDTAEQAAKDVRLNSSALSHLRQRVPERLTGGTCYGYGLTTFEHLFTRRQLLILTTVSDLIAQARSAVLRDAVRSGLVDDGITLEEGGKGATAYADAVATYLAFAVDRMATYGSTLCKWLTKDSALAPSIPQHGLMMSFDFAEGNPFGKSSGEINQCVKVVADCLEMTPASGFAEISEHAAQAPVEVRGYVLATDPPYYDNIAYADISDFFYVWLARSARGIWPSLLAQSSTPKHEELTALRYRHGGVEEAEKHFMHGMKTALSRLIESAAEHEVATVYYAFRQTESDPDGTTSRGWASFLQAMVDSGLSLDGTWPMRTELNSALKTDVNSLASSIVLVCRKRNKGAETIDRSGFTVALRRELPEAIAKIRAAGVGPVDMQQSVIGPGMGVFTRYAEVLDDDDKPLPVKTALAIINRVWQEIDSELLATFDAPTQVALAWFGSYGFDTRASGELITLANAKNTSIDALFASGVFRNLHGKAALTPREELPPDWSPARDKNLTVWECVQHTARVLNSSEGGAAAAGRLLAEMGPRAADARALLDRLFQIATDKGWSQEALVCNQLAEEWPHLLEQAAQGPTPAPTTTGDLFA